MLDPAGAGLRIFCPLLGKRKVIALPPGDSGVPPGVCQRGGVLGVPACGPDPTSGVAWGTAFPAGPRRKGAPSSGACPVTGEIPGPPPPPSGGLGPFRWGCRANLAGLGVLHTLCPPPEVPATSPFGGNGPRLPGSRISPSSG